MDNDCIRALGLSGQYLHIHLGFTPNQGRHYSSPKTGGKKPEDDNLQIARIRITYAL